MARLEQLRTAQGVALPPRLKSEIKRELHRLELVVEMIATLSIGRQLICVTGPSILGHRYPASPKRRGPGKSVRRRLCRSTFRPLGRKCWRGLVQIMLPIQVAACSSGVSGGHLPIPAPHFPGAGINNGTAPTRRRRCVSRFIFSEMPEV
jgi:hypothetical protein